MDEKDKKQEEKNSLKSRMKKGTVALGLAVATMFGGGMDKNAEAANYSVPPKPHKQAITNMNEREAFNDRLRVPDKQEYGGGIKIVIGKKEKEPTFQKKKVQPANIRCATPEENAKITELNQRKSDLIIERMEAKYHNDQARVQALTMEFIKVGIEMEEVLKPIRARQAETSRDER